MKAEQKVVILLSDKRSGSTMVQEELCKHPEINHVEYSPHTYSETHHWLKAACVLEKPHQLFSGHRRYRGYGTRAAARRYLVDCVRGNVPDFKIPDDDGSLVYEGWEALCQRFARPVFFEKSPQTIHHWAALDPLLQWREMTDYEVLFIGLVRNPLAVMSSAESAFQTPAEDRQFGWAEGCRNLLAVAQIVGRDHFRMFRYEDIVDDPPRMFADMCLFLGVSPRDEIGTSVHSDSTKKWALDPGFTLQLDSSVSRVAKHLGYSEEDLMNPHASVAGVGAVPGRRLSGRIKLMRARIFQRVLKPLALLTWQRK